MPVSYTHLDVYKRQGVDHRVPQLADKSTHLSIERTVCATPVSYTHLYRSPEITGQPTATDTVESRHSTDGITTTVDG